MKFEFGYLSILAKTCLNRFRTCVKPVQKNASEFYEFEMRKNCCGTNLKPVWNQFNFVQTI